MEVSWEILKKEIYYWDGSWLDIYVLNTSKEDWIKWAEYINSTYELSFYNYQTDAYENKISPRVLTDYWKNRREDSDIAIDAEISLGTIPIKCHFFDDTQIENDFDPGDINSIDDHNKIIHYMQGLSKALNKAVIMTPENASYFVHISVILDKVKVNIH